jgi:hypothetical protein
MSEIRVNISVAGPTRTPFCRGLSYIAHFRMSAKSNDAAAPAAGGWNFARMLGVEDCCAVQLAPAPKPNASVKHDAPAERQLPAPTPPTAANSTKPQAAETKQQPTGFFAGLAKSVTDAIAQRAQAAENERKSAALDQYLALLKGGVLVTRHIPGEASKPVSNCRPQQNLTASHACHRRPFPGVAQPRR